MIDSLITKTFVVSLPNDADRRKYVKRHFSDIGIVNYEFFEATHWESDKVRAYYEQDLVKKFPGCFRCHQNECTCKNNILIPQQVANWISFIELWRKLSKEKGLFLICEDDVHFYENGLFLLGKLLSDLDINEKFLLRLAASGKSPFMELNPDEPLQLTGQQVMSNPAYIINGEMAAFLVEQLSQIKTTSDIWIHGEMACHPEVQSLTVQPLIATELSFNKEFARFDSNIHPKGIDKDDAARKRMHIKRVSSEAEYDELYNSWFEKK